MKDIRSQLLRESPWKLLISLSIPAILGQFVVGLYAFVDAIYVGQMVGVTAMSAISVSSPFVLINNGIAVLVGIGSGSVLSRAVGAKQDDKVDKIMGNLLVLVLLLSGAVMLVGIPLAPHLLQLGGAQGEALEMGVRYLRIIYCGSFFVNFMQSANMVLRAEGRMGTAMGIMATGAILNIILDPIFIMLTGSVDGAAYATILSQFVQAVITAVYFVRKSPVVRFHRIRLATDLLPGIFSVGSSAMLMQIMFMVQATVVYNTAAGLGGNDQIALMGAAQRVMQFAFVPIWGMSQGMQPAVGTNFGAKQYGRVRQISNAFIVGATVLAGVFFVVIQLLPGQILSAFIKEADIVESGIANFQLMFAIFFSYGLLIMTMTYFQSLGKGMQASVLVLLRQIALVIPLVKILPRFFGIRGVWLALPVNDGVVLIIALFLLAREYRQLRGMQGAALPGAA